MPRRRAGAAPSPPPRKAIVLAFTGASGLPYGMRLLGCLLASGRPVHLVYSHAAQLVARQELGFALPTRPGDARRVLLQRLGVSDDLALTVFGRDDWNAPMASGSNAPAAMVVCPCSMGALAAIANGLADNLIERAADVMLKERRALVLVPRETPLSVVHLENMLRLARAGAVILPPAPGFYTLPGSVGDMVDFVVARILDQLGVDHDLGTRWGEEPVTGPRRKPQG